MAAALHPKFATKAPFAGNAGLMAATLIELTEVVKVCVV